MCQVPPVAGELDATRHRAMSKTAAAARPADQVRKTPDQSIGRASLFPGILIECSVRHA